MNQVIALPKEYLASIKPLLGNDWQDFLQSYHQPATRAVRFSDRRPLMISVEGQKQVPWQPGAYLIKPDSSLGAHPLHWAGAYYLQDASAMVAVAALDPQPGDKVLDLCAAPGGKASQIAQRQKGQGVLLANDPVYKRARELGFNLERMGVINSLVLSESAERIASHFPACFEKVLVDAPCSGEGMFRKDPDSIRHWTPELPKANAQRQLAILHAAAQALAPGGRLVYSTCTFNVVENEGVIQQFLSQNPAFTLKPVVLPGLSVQQTGMLRLWPHQGWGEGHFVALMEKSGEKLRSTASHIKRQEKPKPSVAETALLGAVNAALPDWISDAWQANQVFEGQAVIAPVMGFPLEDLRVLRLGLHVGNLRGNTPIPDHALALAGTPRQALPLDTAHAQAYRQGNTLPILPDLQGFIAPSLRGWPLGWGKAVAGVLKNHYPKGLRKPAASLES